MAVIVVAARWFVQTELRKWIWGDKWGGEVVKRQPSYYIGAP
jgi:hypothetical protein